MNELSASEGVFTTAQALRFGVPRNVVAKACEAGGLVRIAHGAYRMAGTPASQLDDLVAIWKLTDPSKMTHERMPVAAWDGVAVAGSTAASILGIGDFYLSPYRILAPRRFGSRNTETRFGARSIQRDDVSFVHGIPVTRTERTLIDLVLDGEDPSLVQDALSDARVKGLDEERLEHLVSQTKASTKAKKTMERLFERKE
ncbi:MAG: type IV toxin-antitoxin system AbiEi family antitoxin domain-containing protein [Gordonibacter sp.]|uniref:type IV toxin-antitoxin system AbiEi family antitoxin domain-containing protein n=2 Tax=Gordonibacter sp. TaxID=1968902 RepID=UPI002FC7170B